MSNVLAGKGGELGCICSSTPYKIPKRQSGDAFLYPDHSRQYKHYLFQVGDFVIHLFYTSTSTHSF